MEGPRSLLGIPCFPSVSQRLRGRFPAAAMAGDFHGFAPSREFSSFAYRAFSHSLSLFTARRREVRQMPLSFHADNSRGPVRPMRLMGPCDLKRRTDLLYEHTD